MPEITRGGTGPPRRPQALVVPARGVVQTTPRTRVLTLDVRGQTFTFSAGQAVMVGLAAGTVRRPYSIACSPSQAERDHSLELLVQTDGSAGDPHLERAEPGTPVYVEGPFGSFCLPSPIPEPRVLFIAGGTGIAPLRSMIWQMLATQTNVRPTLIYSARAPEEFAFLDEWNQLASDGRLDLYLTVTRDGDGGWSGYRGRLDGTVIASAVSTPETRCLVCGPPAFVTDSASWLRAAGVAPARIQTESA